MKWTGIICVLIAILGTGLAVKKVGFRPSPGCETYDPKYFKRLSKQQIVAICGRPLDFPRSKKPRIRRLADKFAPLRELLNEKP